MAYKPKKIRALTFRQKDDPELFLVVNRLARIDRKPAMKLVRELVIDGGNAILAGKRPAEAAE